MEVCENCGRRFPTTKQREAIRKLADGLRTVQEIADAVGIKYSVVYQQVRKEELAARRVDARARKWERYLLAAREHAAGKTLVQIGVTLGIGRERVRQMIREVERVNRKISDDQDRKQPQVKT